MEKLPPERKQLSGTYRPDRDRKGIEPGARLKDPPEPPPMSDLATAEWRNLAPLLCDLELLTSADLRTLQLLCESLATAAELAAAIEKDGVLLPAANGGLKSNPIIKVLESTRNQAHRLLSDFGLSPKSRKFVSKAPGRLSDSPYAKFRKGNPYLRLDDNDDFEDL